MDFQQFATVFLGQCFGLALLWFVAGRALPIGLEQVMRNSILSRPSGKLFRKD